jgi:hypothetical protein
MSPQNNKPRRHKLIIQANNPTDNPNGPGTIDNWVDFSPWLCNLQLKTGREFWAAQKNNPELSGLAQGRYVAGVTSDMQCKYVIGGVARYFEIIGPPIVPGEKHLEMELHLKEVFR